jgi:hypothetical protein
MWIGLIVLLAVCLLVSCDRSEHRRAANEAEQDLRAMARLKGVEVSELDVSILANEVLSPADRANGIQGRATLILSYAWRCPGETWLDDSVFHWMRKEDGAWLSDPDVGNPMSLPDFGAPLFSCDDYAGDG